MLAIRHEGPADREAVYRVNRLAFDSDVEPRIVEALRSVGQVICSLVAESDGDVVGHILFSPMTIESDGTSWAAACLGPLAVLPSHQRQGIGSQLTLAGLEECRRLGCGAVFLLGHPAYYPRFGFRPAREFDIHFQDDRDAFMAVELFEGALAGIRGNAVFAEELGGHG